MASNALAIALYTMRHVLLIMAKFRFQDLEIWQLAIEIADKLFVQSATRFQLYDLRYVPYAMLYAPCAMRFYSLS